MINPLRLFRLFSKQKFMEMPLKTKIYCVYRIAFALLKLIFLVPLLIVMIVLCSVVNHILGKVTDFVTNDRAMQILFDGLVSVEVGNGETNINICDLKQMEIWWENQKEKEFEDNV